jgi:hypothetical protein
MNLFVIAGLLLTLLSVVALGAGMASGNMFLSQRPWDPAVDTSRRSAPVTFRLVAASWALTAILGIVITVSAWGI